MLSRFLEQLPSFLLGLPAILLALSFHEMCHAWAALKLGDPTARNFGRLTLNPAKHLNLIGFLCMIFFHVGWANPVPINTRNFKNPRRGMALSALAGPLSNVLLGIVSALLLRLGLLAVTTHFGKDLEAILFGAEVGTGFLVVAILVMMLYLSMVINFSYAIFNLLPVPPFDGSRIFYVFLPPKWYFAVMKYERVIMWVLLVLLWTGILTLPLGYIVGGMEKGLFYLLGMGKDTDAGFALALIEHLIASLISV